MFEKPFSKRILLAALLTVLAINIFAQTDPWTQTGPATSISGTWVFRSESLFGGNMDIEAVKTSRRSGIANRNHF